MQWSVLTVHEIYVSVQGESTHVGRPCVFVRLTACDLRCVWCDTPYAFTGGKKMSIDEVVGAVRDLQCNLVELTGGEPLLQPEAIPLMRHLLDDGFEVLVETGGHLPIDRLPKGVHAIMDVKCPGSGEAGKMHWPNLDALSKDHEVKFVIADRADYEYARRIITEHDLAVRAGAVLLSPVHGVQRPDEVVKWMLDDRLGARLQIQAHKFIWTPETRGV
ncbi:MAG: radical SAM protein [Acidobacteria bacterium]|nr:radical SAM protein [Acidobacteriota bacterium]